VEKATRSPPRVSEHWKEWLLPWAPLSVTLTRSVRPRVRSRTKMSRALLVSSRTRFVAAESKATFCPSSETLGM